MDPLPTKPILEWDFRQLPHLPLNSDSRGLQLTSAGLILSGQNAYLHLPLALPIGAYLKSKSILICLRFTSKREPIRFGLKSSVGGLSEKLGIDWDSERDPRGVWVLHRSSQPSTVTFGLSAPIEHSINVDIHLALVADASRPQTTTFTCYRDTEQYGQPAILGGAAAFQASDGIVFTVQQSGSGSVMYSYVKVFDCALSQSQLREVGGVGMAEPPRPAREDATGMVTPPANFSWPAVTGQHGTPKVSSQPYSTSAKTSGEGTLPKRERRSRAGLRDVNLLLEGVEGVPEDDNNLLFAKALYIRAEPATVEMVSRMRNGVSLDKPLHEGWMVTAYYPDLKDAAVLEKSLRNELASFWSDPKGFKLECAPVASVVVHIDVVRHSRRTVNDLWETFMKAKQGGHEPNVTFSSAYDDDIFQLERVAGEWIFKLLPFRRPMINFVLFVRVKAEVAGGSVRELVIVRGKNFRGDLRLMWGVCGTNEPLEDFRPMSTDTLKNLGIMYLTSSPESLAYAFGKSVTELAGQKVFIQWMRPLGEYGSALTFEVSVPIFPAPGGVEEAGGSRAPRDDEMFLVTPLANSSRPAATDRQGALTPSRQPYSTVDWQFDVFISHAGPIKPLALELGHDLRSLGFEAFVDRDALHPGDDADKRMMESAQTAPIGLVLFSEDFMLRPWPVAELQLIVEAGTLLPVAVGMSHTELRAAWRGSPETAGLGEDFFERVTRTTFLVEDRGDWQRPLRERICFAVLRVFVEKVCPRLPDVAASMRHVDRALAAAQKIAEHSLENLTGRDYKAAAGFVKHLDNLKRGAVSIGTPLPLTAYFR